jgi:hypothetical protein
MKTLKLLFIFIAALSLLYSCEDDEIIPKEATFKGGDVSGAWEKNTTYTVEGHIIVPEGKSLTIEEGVTMIMADTSLKIEILVYGNLYCKGTAENPVKITIAENLRTTANAMKGLWGGILCSPTSGEILLDNTIVEYAGAVTTEDSPSVQRGFYKAEAGERLPVLWTSNTLGKVVVKNSVIRNMAEDCFYLEGGKILIMNNTFHTSGVSGGEAVNIKSGCIADVAYNLFFSPNTNALKLSNADLRDPQATVNAYNNTMINCGWRRPSVKGGSAWLENNVNAKIFNNLIANCRFGTKNDGADARSVYDYNMYYGYNQTCVDQFQTTTSKVVRGAHDVAGTTAGQNDPKFVNFPLSTDMFSTEFNTSWNFKLMSGSPAIGKGTTSITGNHTSGISVGGVTYNSPAPSTTIGAFGTN